MANHWFAYRYSASLELRISPGLRLFPSKYKDNRISAIRFSIKSHPEFHPEQSYQRPSVKVCQPASRPVCFVCTWQSRFSLARVSSTPSFADDKFHDRGVISNKADKIAACVVLSVPSRLSLLDDNGHSPVSLPLLFPTSQLYHIYHLAPHTRVITLLLSPISCAQALWISQNAGNIASSGGGPPFK